MFQYPAFCPASAKDAGIHPKKQFLPVTLISDGHLLADNLALAGKDAAWLKKILQSRRTTVQDTWLLTVDAGENILWYSREDAS